MMRTWTGRARLAALAVLISLHLQESFSFSLSNEDVIDAESAQEYLGRFTYFRGWTTRRRLHIVRTRDDKMENILKEAIYRFRCPLAIRNVNLILLGDSAATETIFFHSEDNRRDFIKTRKLSDHLRTDMEEFLVKLYTDLNYFDEWNLLIGYDGGRKRMYRKVNFIALFDKIDSMPMRQREMALQEQKHINCIWHKRLV